MKTIEELIEIMKRVPLTASAPDDSLIIIDWEQVERMRGVWIENQHAMLDSTTCSNCKTAFQKYYENYPFCPRCGSPMTDEAVQMVMKRLEALND